MFVCVCNALNEKKVLKAISDGAKSAEEIYAACDVDAQCGSCADMMDRMVDGAHQGWTNSTAMREKTWGHSTRK